MLPLQTSLLLRFFTLWHFLCWSVYPMKRIHTGNNGKTPPILPMHVNVKYTEDGGAPPYDYAKAPLSHEDVTIDTRRLDDYELLSAEEILGGEQSF